MAGAYVPGGATTKQVCEAICNKVPECVAYEWASRSTDPNAKANCALGSLQHARTAGLRD